jgi:hypothetical protein
MGPILDIPIRKSTDEPEPAHDEGKDVPGKMAERVGQLYAEEERADRVARTEQMIRSAEQS